MSNIFSKEQPRMYKECLNSTVKGQIIQSNDGKKTWTDISQAGIHGAPVSRGGMFSDQDRARWSHMGCPRALWQWLQWARRHPRVLTRRRRERRARTSRAAAGLGASRPVRCRWPVSRAGVSPLFLTLARRQWSLVPLLVLSGHRDFLFRKISSVYFLAGSSILVCRTFVLFVFNKYWMSPHLLPLHPCIGFLVLCVD